MPVITGISGPDGTPAVVQFVDTISTTAVVRFDFNDLEPSMVTKLSLPSPPLRFARSSTMLADGDRISASAYGNRQITITAEFQSDNRDSASAALSVLARELDRPTNILKVQIGSNPTFYRTYRASVDPTMLNYDITYLEAGVVIEAEPFGLGLPQIVPGQNPGGGNSTRISNDPAYTGPDQLPGRCIDVTDVLGDVETPAQMFIVTNWTPPGSYGNFVVAARRSGVPSALTTVFQAEGLTSGFDTTVAGSHDATLSGVGNNYQRCTFATHTAAVENRAGLLWPPAATSEARGTFRVYARIRANGSGTVAVAASYNDGPILQPAVTVTAGSGPMVLDLGTFTAPPGGDPVYDGFSGTAMPIATVARVWLLAGRSSGSATLDIDYLAVIPADDHLTVASFNGYASTTYEVLDATADAVYQTTTLPGDPAGIVLYPSNHSYSGALPMLSPGTNRLYVVAPVYDPADPAADTDLNGHVDLTIRYWPRYLTLATV